MGSDSLALLEAYSRALSHKARGSLALFNNELAVLKAEHGLDVTSILKRVKELDLLLKQASPNNFSYSTLDEAFVGVESFLEEVKLASTNVAISRDLCSRSYVVSFSDIKQIELTQIKDLTSFVRDCLGRDSYKAPILDAALARFGVEVTFQTIELNKVHLHLMGRNSVE